MHEKNFKGINDFLRPAYFIPLNKRINDLLRDFKHKHIQMAIVTTSLEELQASLPWKILLKN